MQSSRCRLSNAQMCLNVDVTFFDYAAPSTIFSKVSLLEFVKQTFSFISFPFSFIFPEKYWSYCRISKTLRSIYIYIKFAKLIFLNTWVNLISQEPHNNKNTMHYARLQLQEILQLTSWYLFWKNYYFSQTHII